MHESSGRGPQPFEPTPSVFDATVSTVDSLAGRSTVYSMGVITSSVYGSAETCNSGLSAWTSKPGEVAPVTAAQRTSSWLPHSIGLAYGVMFSRTVLEYCPTSNPRLRST